MSAFRAWKAVGESDNGRAALTAKKRVVSWASVLFVALMVVQFALPDVSKESSQGPYLAVVAGAVEVVYVAVCLLARTLKTRNTANDICVSIFGVLTVWLVATAKTGVLSPNLFPAPGVVFAQIVDDWQKILGGIGSSLGIVFEGFVLGGIAAVLLGLFLGWSARSNTCAEKVVSFLAAIPPIVYIPYGIALLPTFRASSVLVIFLATFWPVLTGTLAGVSRVDSRATDSAKVLGVSTPTMFSRIVLPGALPLIFNGFNIALVLSFILLTSAEMIGGNTGMGYYVKYYSDFGDYTRILAGIIVIGVVITTISTAFARLQAHLLRWQ